MKKRKSLAALACVATLVIGGIAITFADEPTITVPTTTISITVDEAGVSNTFAAYKLLDVTVTTKDGKETYKYSVNEKYRTALKTLTGQDKDGEIITYISKLNAEEIRKFADDFYALGFEADYTTTNAKFSDIPQGYYLIAETEPGAENDTLSLVMLDTAAKTEVTIKTKEDIPSSDKKTKDVNDSTGVETGWQDSSDYDIGDDVPFRFTVGLPSDYDAYETYELIFHDKESKGLTFNANSVVVKVNDNIVSDGYVVKTSDIGEDTFQVVFSNLKTIATKKTDVVTVEYTSKLNEEAVIGNHGNPNKMHIEYSNNPYGDGTGKGPDDVVVVFTYKPVVLKVDGAGDPLVGAGFTLFKYDFEKGEYKATRHGEIKGEEISTFEFTGIDDGLYKLVETTVPEGFNKAADIEFEVTAEHEILSANPKLTNLSVGDNQPFEIDVEAGTLKTTVENLTGNELPETGGIGTTIFYVIGGVLVLAGGILFITKKKMDSDRED